MSDPLKLAEELRQAEAHTAELRAMYREAVRAKVSKPTAEQCAQLVSSAEIARRTGMTRAAVSNWKTRGLGFPESMVESNDATLYWWPDVEDWLLERGIVV